MSISEDNNRKNENEEYSDSYFNNLDNSGSEEGINAESTEQNVSGAAENTDTDARGEIDPASVNHGSTGTNSANDSTFFGGSHYSSPDGGDEPRDDNSSGEKPFFGGAGNTYGRSSGSYSSGHESSGSQGYGTYGTGYTGTNGTGYTGTGGTGYAGGSTGNTGNTGWGYQNGPNGGRGSYGYSSSGGGPHRDFGDIYEEKKKKRPESATIQMTKKKAVSLFVACMVLSGAVSVGAAWGYSNYSNTGSVTGSNSGYTLESATGSDKTVSQIASQNTESVVEISTESVSTDSWAQQYVVQGAGSGIIIDSDGYIMTNYHVIEGASKITVRNDNNKTYTAKVIGYDKDNDIAVIKIDASGLKAVKYGNSNQISVGDMAVIIGNPLGELGDSVTAGIISSTSREITLDNNTMNLIQTDASVNPGNSGGGLFNSKGQLIGVVVAKASSTDVEGLGFAIPVNKAAKIASEIMNNE